MIQDAFYVLAVQKHKKQRRIKKYCFNFFFNLKNKQLTMRPINDRVLVKPAAAEETTKGGIIIPDTAKEKPQRGTVIAVGPGKEDRAMTVKIDDVVLYGKYSGQEVSHNGEDFLIMKEDDILLILD
ncbi:co-chaperone GroES [Aureispira anguillae]|uniref:Co-chaperonin GroES n=2 Tax=Aureispira anguillae TaxID=2864201 RepID=A0A916DV82_9BACT|nr:co-chaperone GroES [Aureispira anguillae]